MTYDAVGQYYSYDQENRISGAGGFTYTYDANGNRVEKSTGGSAPTGTLYWYMSPGIVAESDLNGNLQSEYVFFDGERVARKDFPGFAVSYYFSDHLKTTDIVTDSQGNIKNESDFYPWGGELQFLNNDSNHYKFTGKERDSETQLDYFGARYYSNSLGRFLTPDWSATPVPVPYADLSDPQTLNQYSYVRNIPTSRADQDGHCDICQKFKNLFNGNGWRTDQQVKDDAQAFRNSVGQNQRIGTYDRDTGQVTTYTRDQLNKMSDSQVLQLKDKLDNSEPANNDDLQKIGQVLAQAVVSFAPSQIQAKFKHAEDFGVKGNYNKANGQAYEKALRDHIADPDTKPISGTYRGQPADIYYNSRTGNAVITDKAGNYVSGWKLSADQVQHLLSNGKLGGG
jgi:RHS repeat-associated protein